MPRSVNVRGLSVGILLSAFAGCVAVRSRPDVDRDWIESAETLIAAELRTDKAGARAQRDAERALMRGTLPTVQEARSLIGEGAPHQRHAAVVAVMVRGLADGPLGMAMLARWPDMGHAEKIHVIRAIDDRGLWGDRSLQDMALRAFEGESDPRVQVFALLTVRDEFPSEMLLPLLTAYSATGADVARSLAFTTATKSGRAEDLKRGLRQRGAENALAAFEKWEKEQERRPE